MRTVSARASSKNSSPCSPPRHSSAERILETGRSESAAASDIGPPRGFQGSEYIIQTIDIFPEERMRILVATGALALLLFLAPAGASKAYARPMGPRYEARAYASFLAGYLDSREGNLDNALASYRKALKYAGDEPDILYEIANVLVKKGRLQEARAELEKALKVDEGHTRSRYLLAGILAASGEREKALAEYGRVLKEDPENDEAYLHVATLHAERGELSQSEDVLDQLIARNPDFYLAYYYRGRLLAARKKFDEALADYDKALTVAPGFDAALIESGAVLEILGRNAEAEERYRTALRASPNNQFLRDRLGRLLIREKKKISAANIDVRTKLGLLYLDRDRFDDAINEFTFVLASEPGNTQVRFFLGTAYEEKGALPEAEETFRKIPEGDPVYREAMLHLSMLLSRQKKPDEAIEVVRKLREKSPGDVELMIFLAGQLEGAKRYEEALAVATEATEKAPENPAAWFSLGVIQDKLGKLDQVITSMEKVISLDPKHATALNYLGYTFADRNMRLPEAEKLILRALEIRPEDGYFLDSLAWVHFREGNYRRAEEELLRALKTVPDDPVVLEHLGDVLHAQGRDGEAAAQFEKAIAKGHEKPDEVRAKLQRLRKARPSGK